MLISELKEKLITLEKERESLLLIDISNMNIRAQFEHFVSVTCIESNIHSVEAEISAAEEYCSSIEIMCFTFFCGIVFLCVLSSLNSIA